MVAPGENLNGLEFGLTLLGLFAYHFAFYALFPRVFWGPRQYGPCVFLYGQGLGLLSLSLFFLFGKTAVFPIAYSLALVVAWGYALADAVFRLVSPRYRRRPDFYLEAIKEVTLPRGAEAVYLGLERFREQALCLPAKVAGLRAFMLAPLLTFPFALFLATDALEALAIGVEGLLVGIFIATLGFSVDLAAALLRYRWI